ncbi:nSTAND1 domain-containing NTPase [Streptomyces bicolor]|uniref:nSTAND1 domain-containing NTPase n=1 Tax=Streptomyces bicolor TaxID=66874 RepID=UPI0034DCD461
MPGRPSGLVTDECAAWRVVLTKNDPGGVDLLRALHGGNVTRDETGAVPGARELAPAPVCPFRGLSPFRETDAPVFHGRRVECAELVSVVANNQWSALVGPSGSGKSSLVSVTAESWLWITFSAEATEGHHKRDHERPWVMCSSGTCGSTRPKAS